jgi:hypothetical protein
MFNAGDFISDTEEKIASMKRRARWAMAIGYAAWFITIVLVISGTIKGCAVLASHPYSDSLTAPLARFGVWAWNFMNDHLPWLWPFVWSISPYPDLTQTAPRLTIGFILWVYGLLAISIGLRKLSKFFYRKASELENFLQQQGPILLQLQTMSGQNIDISGNSNVVNAFNNITHMREKIEKKVWWEGPWGVIATGVAAIAIAKFLHLS